MPSRMPVAVLLAAMLALAQGVRAQPDASPETEDEPRPRTLYQRIGGTYVLARVVDVFVNGMFADPVVRANPAVRREAKLSRRPGLKFQITSLLCQETGGPCKYEGRTLREAHVGLSITEHEWDAMIADFKKALVVARVPAAERSELLNLLTTSKDDIVRRR